MTHMRHGYYPSPELSPTAYQQHFSWSASARLPIDDRCLVLIGEGSGCARSECIDDTLALIAMERTACGLAGKFSKAEAADLCAGSWGPGRTFRTGRPLGPCW